MSPSERRPIWVAIAIAAALVACRGRIGPADGASGPDRPNTPGQTPDDPTDSENPTEGPAAPSMTSVPRGPALARRLTAEQFHNSLVDLFQDPGVPVAEVLTDPPVFGFHVDARAGVVRDLDAQQLMTYAERVAEWAIPQKLGQISPCQNNDASCRRQFIETFGRRAFRAPLSAIQVDRYETLMSSGADFNDGAQLVITAMVQSPTFLYRREIGEPMGSDRVRLTPFELATNLAYLVTHSTPDEALLRAAEQGNLSTPDDVLRELDRLLETPAARRVLGDFIEGWLEIDDLVDRVKANEQQANFSDDVRRSMLNETRTLFTELFYSDGRFSELLTANYTYIDQRLSQYYQLWGVGGEDFVRMDIPDNRRPAGVLGHGSFLARHSLSEQSSPVLRGYTIRKRFMCEHIAPPPPGIDTMIGARPVATTTREKYLEHSTNEFCASCHQLMDPIGFTFEHYDEFGRFRDNDNGFEIDTSGNLVANPHVPENERVPVPEGGVNFIDHREVTAFLSGAPEVEACFARFLTYFSLGVSGVAVDEVIADATARGGSLRNYLEAIVTSPHFFERVAP